MTSLMRLRENAVYYPRRSDRLGVRLRHRGGLLGARRGSEDVVLRNRCLSVWRSQYRINETAMAAFETDIAVGPLGSVGFPAASTALNTTATRLVRNPIK